MSSSSSQTCCKSSRIERRPDAKDAALCQEALNKPVVSPAVGRDDLVVGDTALCQAELHRPVVESAARRGNLGSGEADPYRVALHNPIVGSTEGGDSQGLGKAAPYRAALCRLWIPYSDPEIEDHLRDTPEPRTPPVRSLTPERPLTPGAARIAVEAVNGPVVNVEAVVEILLPWLKHDIYSSKSSNPRTPSPEIEVT